jgi:hypothetical protein
LQLLHIISGVLDVILLSAQLPPEMSTANERLELRNSVFSALRLVVLL